MSDDILAVTTAAPGSVEERILRHAYEAAGEIIARIDGQLPADVVVLIDTLANQVSDLGAWAVHLPPEPRGILVALRRTVNQLVAAKDRAQG